MSMSALVEPAGESLYMIPLPVAMQGFDRFITAWAYTAGPVVVVDVGPASASQRLLSALAELGVTRPDLILLTHVHIDHAGGIGAVARAFPQTPVVCHPKAVAHLIDPQRLWEGSLKTLGDVARRYGAIEPVKAAQVMAVDQLHSEAVRAVPTPGHAPHHYSYLMKDLVFAGEAGGVCLELAEGRYFMRPATPPRFRIQISLESIQRLIDLNPRKICYGHVGMQPEAVGMLEHHREQLLHWQDLIGRWRRRHPKAAETGLSDCLTYLLASDPLLARFSELPADVQARERFFLTNSVKGYWEYLDQLQDRLAY